MFLVLFNILLIFQAEAFYKPFKGCGGGYHDKLYKEWLNWDKIDLDWEDSVDGDENFRPSWLLDVEIFDEEGYYYYGILVSNRHVLMHANDLCDYHRRCTGDNEKNAKEKKIKSVEVYQGGVEDPYRLIRLGTCVSYAIQPNYADFKEDIPQAVAILSLRQEAYNELSIPICLPKINMKLSEVVVQTMKPDDGRKDKCFTDGFGQQKYKECKMGCFEGKPPQYDPKCKYTFQRLAMKVAEPEGNLYNKIDIVEIKNKFSKKRKRCFKPEVLEKRKLLCADFNNQDEWGFCTPSCSKDHELTNCYKMTKKGVESIVLWPQKLKGPHVAYFKDNDAPSGIQQDNDGEIGEENSYYTGAPVWTYNEDKKAELIAILGVERADTFRQPAIDITHLNFQTWFFKEVGWRYENIILSSGHIGYTT